VSKSTKGYNLLGLSSLNLYIKFMTLGTNIFKTCNDIGNFFSSKQFLIQIKH